MGTEEGLLGADTKLSGDSSLEAFVQRNKLLILCVC